MKNQNSYSIITVILVGILTGCSGFSNSGIVSELHSGKKNLLISKTFSTLSSIVKIEFSYFSAISGNAKV